MEEKTREDSFIHWWNNTADPAIFGESKYNSRMAFTAGWSRSSRYWGEELKKCMSRVETLERERDELTHLS